jgi:hypothetical protein
MGCAAASGVAKKRVPSTTPSAPSAKAATKPRASAMPLAQRYDDKISNIEFVASNSRGAALKALEQGAPVMVGSGYHWVMVVRSPRGQLWENSYKANEASGVCPISGAEFQQLGSLFEIIVDATTKEPIPATNAGAYRK